MDTAEPDGRPAVAVCWPRMGPYHRARLNAAAGVLGGLGYRTVGLETDPADPTYAWSTLGSDPRGWQLMPVTERQSLTMRLDQLAPAVVCINGWGFQSSRAVFRWARRAGTGIVLMSDSRRSDRRRRFWAEAIKRRFVRRCDAAIVAANQHADYIEQLGMPRGRIHLGLDVVDNEHFAAGAERARTIEPSKRGYLLGIGRWVDKKNWPLVLRTYADVVADRPTAPPLRLVGGGVDGAQPAASLIDRLALTDRVTLTPFVQYEQLPALYAGAIATILASRGDEQWGLVVNESMASGTPAIVSGACGCAEPLIDHGQTGWRFDPTAADQLRSTMLAAIDQPADQRLAMVSAARQRVGQWGTGRFAAALAGATRTAVGGA